ncbi:MAG TPA: transglycosylase SLT domain-containing protein [Methylomirabilota bacterium]|nr:transglycosylase SLT domain-containing protein [Methylomirabilota bacterium]
MIKKGAGNACWLGVLAGLVLVGPAEAGMFRFEDASGVVHFTNAPSDPRYRGLPGWIEPQPAPRSITRSAAPTPFAELIQLASSRYRVDPRLVQAVVVVESAGNPRAVSRKGAQGLMQLMPQRSAELGVRNAFDPQQNVDGGVRHLRDLLERFSGDVTLALAAYNAGEVAVRTHQGVPPYPETQDYVRKVRALYQGVGGSGASGSAANGSRPVGTATQAPQEIYRQVEGDGTVLYTNVPPRPAPRLKPRS